MFAKVIKRHHFLRRLYQLQRPQKLPIPKVLVLTTPYPFANLSVRDTMENFDAKLQEACQQGESAVNELMSFLKQNVQDISKDYKESLKKQIEIVEAATKAGAQSSKWDELPEFRTKTEDLSRQFNEFAATIQVLGNLAANKLLQLVGTHSKLLEEKHKELEKIVTKELKEIKALEAKLLAKNKNSIEKAK